MVTRMLLPAPHGPLDGWETAPPGDDGRYYSAAVLVPGEESMVFVPLMEALALAGFRVLTVEPRAGLDPATAARDLDVAVTAAAARRPVHLAGCGTGAEIAARMAEAEPEKCLSLAILGLDDRLDAARAARIAASGIPVLRVPGHQPEMVGMLADFWRAAS